MRLHDTLRGLAALVLAGGLALSAAVADAATIIIVNNDGAGEGFNDATAVAPVGGNPGVTRGQQRLNVFTTAANMWGAMLPSAVTISVASTFDPLTCTATSATLGSTGPQTAHRDFAGAIFPGTWYHQSLANKLAGVDLSANPDMTSRFNSTLDGGTCLGGLVWYYGYDGLEGANVELLPVVLHELGHGLNFSTLTNGSTGAYFNLFPSVFDQFLYDNTTGLVWSAETAAQRAASAIALDKLAWNGNGGRYVAAHFLAKRKRMVVNSPGGIAGIYGANVAAFGPQNYSVTGNVVLVDDGVAPNSDGCTPLVNAAAVAGNIALIDRGTCTFVLKAQAAQAAGAIAVIIANNAAGALAPGGTDPSITIPVVGITLADGNTLKANLPGVNVTLDADPALLTGADNSGRPLMYTPNPFTSGSSVSHFDVTATPNALMEPAINSDLHTNVDMTLGVFSDVGWLDYTVSTTLATFDATSDAEGIRIHWVFSDPSDVRVVTVERATSDAGPWAPVAVEILDNSFGTVALDASAAEGKTYYYRLQVTDRAGNTQVQGLATARREATFRGAAVLMAPRPNPADRGTAVTFRLGQPEYVRLSVLDASGRLIRTVHDGMLSPGEHTKQWDGMSDGSKQVPAGLYFFALKTSKGTVTQRIAVVH